jgi:ankyrin repeat protein
MAGADVNAQGGYFGDALQGASYGGYIKIIKTLLNNGANVNSIGGEFGSALQAASYCGHLKTIGVMISHGANIDARGGSNDITALQAAVKMATSRL